MTRAKGRRPKIPVEEALPVWVAAAGRCTFCNAYVLESEPLGIPVLIAELAHIVGWSPTSPRGDDPLPLEDRQKAENLMLACRNCHKPIDQKSVLDLYTVEQLRQRKREHETRMKLLTDLSPDRQAFVIRVVSKIRGTDPELSRATVLDAVTQAGYYPQMLPASHWQGVEADLRPLGDLDAPEDYERCLPQLEALATRVGDGVAGNDVGRLAVFAFARIPVLIALGAALDDKIETLIFQRHRASGVNAWKWPQNPAPVPTFSAEVLRTGSRDMVALVLNLSGHIGAEDLPEEILETHTVYVIQPVNREDVGVGVIDGPDALTAFEGTVRRFMGMVEREHGRLDHVALFPAVGVASAVVLGQVLMPDVSPAWHVYDRKADGGTFYKALEVRK